MAPSAYPLGGVAVWLDNLCKQLPVFGWEPKVGLVSGRWHDAAGYRAAYPELPTTEVPNPTGSAEGRRRALAKLLREYLPEIVVGVNIGAVYPASVRLRAQGMYFRTVLALHGISASLLKDVEMYRQSLDAVVATNRLSCRLSEDVGGMPNSRVLYAPYGVDLQPFSAAARDHYDGPVRIALVGRLDFAQKNIETIPEILRQLERLGVDYRFVVAGDGPDREWLERTLRPQIDKDCVKFLGSLDTAVLAKEVYAQADVLLLTSRWETGPLVAWEAMTAGLAVVCSRYVGSGLEGALKDGRNCLMFDIGDAEGAASRIAMLRDRDLREQLVRAGKQLVRDRYSMRKSGEAWAASFDAILTLPLRDIEPREIPPERAGRLDWAVGTSVAESIRRFFRIRFDHQSPGGEWPHTGALGVCETSLLERARKIDVSRA